MSGSEGSPQGGLSTIQMQSLTKEIHKRTNQMGNQIANKQATLNNSRRDEQSNEGDESQFEEEDNEEEQPRRKRPNQNNQMRQKNRREDDLGGIKIKVFSFQGKSDLKHTWSGKCV
ncbi:hypothetical protein CR513_00855, partial [Mucuna pruriens]